MSLDASECRVTGQQAGAAQYDQSAPAALFSDPVPATSHGFGIGRTSALLEMLGQPQEQVPAVHIAGTAGKGSVAAFVTALLLEHGFRVGTYMSPHVHSVAERFQVDGCPVEPSLLAATVRQVNEAAERPELRAIGAATSFERATATAYQLFANRRVDYMVIETGLGGLHDATNVIQRRDKVAVLTSIGSDHTDVLGDTVADIAVQKAGILPPHGEAVVVRSGYEADAAVIDEAVKRRCTLHAVDPAEVPHWIPENLRLRLPGDQQRVNAAAALHAVELLAGRDRWILHNGLAMEALRRVQLPGRFELRHWNKHPIVLDGAHNAMKLAALVQILRHRHPGCRPVWVVALKHDKDLTAAMNAIASNAGAVIATTYGAHGDDEGRAPAIAADVVAASAKKSGVLSAHSVPNLAEALNHAVNLSGPGTPVIVSGSFFLVADVGKLTDQ